MTSFANLWCEQTTVARTIIWGKSSLSGCCNYMDSISFALMSQKWWIGPLIKVKKTSVECCRTKSSLVCLSAKNVWEENQWGKKKERRRRKRSKSDRLRRFFKDRQALSFWDLFLLLSTVGQTLGSPPQCRSPQSSAPLALLSLHISVFMENSSPGGPHLSWKKYSGYTPTHSHTHAYTHIMQTVKIGGVRQNENTRRTSIKASNRTFNSDLISALCLPLCLTLSHPTSNPNTHKHRFMAHVQKPCSHEKCGLEINKLHVCLALTGLMCNSETCHLLQANRAITHTEPSKHLYSMKYDKINTI